MKLLLLAAIGAVLGGSPALAADLSTNPFAKAPASTTPVHNWGGWYVGVTAGGVWGKSNVGTSVFDGGGNLNATPADRAIAAAGTGNLKSDGFTAGGVIGYNHQVDRWLFGVEADASVFNTRQSRAFSGPIGLSVISTNQSVATDWLFTLRPRVGVTFDQTLFYLTGGLALTEMKYSGGFSDNLGQSGATGFSRTKAGWTAGVGVEHAFAPNWTAKVEYIYTDFGKQSSAGPLFLGLAPTPSTIVQDVDLKSSTVRGGVNYHFGGPPIARY